ncbi:MAG: HDOD domain-containing protein [Proteobacteria bacterium]|nr:HDOD domain-containing protein [Desulfobacula sp.]MBU3953382.1 HDOD domain-containing protein [Pseudomonadota bacterium]MBU4132388.1 HDOD domain-containing protein [Pseudomonadota bacterium]
MKPNTSDPNLNPVAFARLPIFDGKKNLWGYELVYYSADGDQGSTSGSSDRITPDLMSGTSLALDQTMDREKKIMVNFSRKNLLDNLPYTLPPGRTTVKIADPSSLSELHIKALSKLQQDGYQMTITWSKNHGNFPIIFGLADIICMDISNRVLPDLVEICSKAADYGSVMLANQVDNQTRFDICHKAGFSFFQGSFFKQPEDISVKKIVSGTISKFELLKAIEQKDPDFSKLAATIQADVAISFRLLSYLNSASFGVRRKVDSIKDAITMLGWDNLKTWLRVVLLAEVSENRHAPELIFLSAQRGKFLEQVGLAHDFWGFEPDSLFLLGMFSLLDALLNQPMAEVVKYLPLADKLKGALCMVDNNEYVPLLKLARFFEEAAFEQSDTMINQLGLDTIKTKQAYCSAIDWANKLSKM